VKSLRASKWAMVMIVFALAIITAACSSSAATPTPAPVYTRVTPGTLKAGDAIPAPSQDIVLTVTGKIGTTNAGSTIVMDVPTLESVGLVDYKVHDPFEDKDVTYEGPLMSDLLALWKVPSDATNLHVVALNDYVVDVPISDIRQWPVVFAMKEDGTYMPVSTHGPAMLVYPYNDFQFDHTVYNDRWAWQIKSIEIQ
jgi:hypothetical protein